MIFPKRAAARAARINKQVSKAVTSSGRRAGRISSASVPRRVRQPSVGARVTRRMANRPDSPLNNVIGSTLQPLFSSRPMIGPHRPGLVRQTARTMFPEGSARKSVLFGRAGTTGRSVRKFGAMGTGGVLAANAVLAPRPPSSGRMGRTY